MQRALVNLTDGVNCIWRICFGVGHKMEKVHFPDSGGKWRFLAVAAAISETANGREFYLVPILA
jgi:hypothetical protein